MKTGVLNTCATIIHLFLSVALEQDSERIAPKKVKRTNTMNAFENGGA